MDSVSHRASFEIAPIPLVTLVKDDPLHARFLEVQAPWVARGTARWLRLIDPHGPWPVRIWGATTATGEPLLGTLVAVWAPTPLSRFDDLLESSCPTGDRATARPSGGTWHFIAVTRHPQGASLGLGRALVAYALATLADEATGASARTLSPAVGLPQTAHLFAPTRPFGPITVAETLQLLSDREGRPCLKVLRLHLGAGSRLDAALWASRADDTQSGAVTLRFAYPPLPTDRDAQREVYGRWVAARHGAIREGKATAVDDDGDLWLHPASETDATLMNLPLLNVTRSQ